MCESLSLPRLKLKNEENVYRVAVMYDHGEQHNGPK